MQGGYTTDVIHVTTDRVIDEPIEVVFDRLVDIDRYRSWMPRSGLFRESRRTDHGPIGEGTEFVDETVLGRFRGRIEQFEPPTQIAFHQELRWRGSPVFISKPGYTLEPVSDGQGTLVHHRAEGEFRGPYRILEPVARWIARRERNRTVDALVRSFEEDLR